jgi:hypothetical protein
MAKRAESVIKRDMPNPTPEQLESDEFEVLWQAIKSWDVNVPDYYHGYCGANGSHVALILNALDSAGFMVVQVENPRPAETLQSSEKGPGG